MKIDVSLLLYFVAVAEELSFRKASDRLNIAQPWLSRQVRVLENQLGFNLFVRTTRHVELTEKGRRLLDRAWVMSREVEATRSLANALMREEPDRLRFGVPFFALYVHERMKIFDLFHQKYPHVKLEILTGNGPQLRTDMLEGRIDATFSAGPLDEKDVEALTLTEKPNEVLLSEKDPLVNKTSLRPADIAGRNLSVFPRELNVGLYDDLFGPFGKKAGRVMEFSNLSYAHHLAEHNAVTIIPGWSSGQHFVGVRRPIVGVGTTKLQLLRSRFAQSEALQNFWNIALPFANNSNLKVAS